MELDEYRRAVNRQHINALLDEVAMETFQPVISICAKARANYIECLMEIASESGDNDCSTEQIEKLRQHRLAYDELISAANALEIVIKRGYVDVKQD